MRDVVIPYAQMPYEIVKPPSKGCLNLPYVYPVAEGGVRFEWSIGPQDVSLEIDLRERSGEWHSLNLETDDEEAQLLKLDTKDGWEWIVERLQTLSGAAS